LKVVSSGVVERSPFPSITAAGLVIAVAAGFKIEGDIDVKVPIPVLEEMSMVPIAGPVATAAINERCWT
jgi:hypothetical protein